MNILIADDHMIVRNGLSQLLNDQNDMSVVAEAASGTEAYVKLEATGADLVLLDISMPPGENGLHTAKRMKESFPNIPIVMLTMYDDHHYMEQALAAGIEGFVVKSDPNAVLLQAIRKAANGGTYYSGLQLDDLNASPRYEEDEAYKTLTKREKELLPLIALGYSNKQIASQLFISVKTVEVHKTNIRKKLALDHYADLLRYCVNHQLIDF